MSFKEIYREFSKNRSSYTLWILASLFFVYQYGVRCAVPSVLNEDLQKYFSIDATKMGGLVSLFYLAYTVMQIPVGIIIDRCSAKKILVCAFLAVSVGEITFVSTDVYLIAAISQIVLGIGASFGFVLIMKVSDDCFSREKVALASSVAVSVGCLGPVMMNSILSHLTAVFPWKMVVIFAGLFGVVLSMIAAMVTKGKVGSSKTSKGSIIGDIKSILVNRQYIGLSVFSMTALAALSTFCDTWGLTFLRHSYNLSKEEASMYMAASYVGVVLGEPAAAWLSKYLHSFKKVMMLNTVIAFSLYFALIFVSLGKAQLMIFLFMLGFFASCQFLAFPAALCYAPKNIGATLTGVVNMITMLGVTLLSYLVGVALDFFHGRVVESVYSVQDYQNSFILLLVSVAISFVSMLFVKDVYPTSTGK